MSPSRDFATTSSSYRPRAGGIEVIRVLYGAMDLDSVLAEEFGISDDDDPSV